MKKKICIFGRHGKRTPFSYPSYAYLLSRFFDFTSVEEDADLLIVGFVIDIKDNFKKLHNLCKSSARRIVVVSEEPLWDTVWSSCFDEISGAIECDGEVLEYTYLNHWTSDIFHFSRLPYYITTTNDYFTRYSYMFQRNALLSTNDLLSIWKKADGKAALYFERRDSVQFDCKFTRHSTYGLSRYRTLFAMEARDNKAKVVGKGWIDGAMRQSLPDWHLDKLAEIDRNYLFCSAIENTHAPNYITEKLFDAFSSVAVPITFFEESHDVKRLVVRDALLDISNMLPSEAAMLIRSWRPGLAYANIYLHVQRQLALIFKNPDILFKEREIFVHKLTKCINECI